MYLFFLAKDACDNVNVLKIVYYIKEFLKITFFLIPMVLMAIVSIDFFKSVISNEDEKKKNVSLVIRRLIYVVVLFLIPSLVEFSITIFAKSGVGYDKCLNVTKNDIKNQIISNKNECIGDGNDWNSDTNECLLKQKALDGLIDGIVSGVGVLIRNTNSSDGSVDEISGDVSGNSNKEKIWNFLISKGFTKEQTAGIMGNIRRESSKFDPTALNSHGGAYGIIQWKSGRKNNLKAYAEKNGKKYSDLELQLNFIMEELNGTEKKAMKKIKEVTGSGVQAVKDAALVWNRYYERSGESAKLRQNYALKIYKEFT